MSEKKITIHDFSEHLFWDVDKNTLDLEKHKRYVIKYVIMYGMYPDWKKLEALYGLDSIAEIAENLRELDIKTASYIALLSDKDIQKFSCYTSKQSNPQHWV